jgi:hypothetical protein
MSNEPVKNSESYGGCTICSQLSDHEHAFRKGGQEADDTYLPPAVDTLELVKVIDRSKQLRRCPQCGRYYLYESIYEYLVYGSEDEEWLRRLSDEEARTFLDALL